MALVAAGSVLSHRRKMGAKERVGTRRSSRVRALTTFGLLALAIPCGAQVSPPPSQTQTPAQAAPSLQPALQPVVTGAGGITINLGANQASGEDAAGDSLIGIENVIGSARGDRLTGGDGADRFIFKSITDSTVASSGRDAIFDFDRLEGDKIDLSVIDASTKLSGNQAFKFLGSAAYTKTAGELRTVVKNGDTFIYGDVNGDGATDFSIFVDTSARIYSTDFIL